MYFGQNWRLLVHNVPVSVIRPTSRLVKETIDTDPAMQDALVRGYANLSSMARIVKSRVEEFKGKELNIDSIITSIKRLRGTYRQVSHQTRKVVAASTVNVRTDVAKISLEKSRRGLETLGKMMATYQNEFIQVSEGTIAVTVVFDQKIRDEIREMFRTVDILEDESDLAAIMVNSPTEIIRTPGCAITFYNQVSRRGINIEDTVSCFTDTVIVVKMEDVGKAFAALTELISAARLNTEPAF